MCIRDRVWVENERSLRITIQPSFWETAWAMAIYILAFLLILFKQTPWAKRSLAIGSDRGVLIQSGKLRDSIHAVSRGIDRIIYQTDPLAYAKIHNEGGYIVCLLYTSSVVSGRYRDFTDSMW